MIFGIGVDLTQVSRFEKWVSSPNMLNRFFNEKEMSEASSFSVSCQHYAVRFAAKEAFGKALGTGILGFDLKDVFIVKDCSGRPSLQVEKTAAKLLQKICGKCKLHVSLSHEKEYAIAYVMIESV